MTDTAVHTATLRVPGARLAVEVRGRGPLLVLHAAPMDAAAFGPLAELLADRFTVVTADPRGIGRSVVDDVDRDVAPDERADDLAAIIAHVGAGPARLFGSSGGAVSALALAQRHPTAVSTVIAHEPPLAEVLPDRDELLRETEQIVATYLAGDRVEAWRQYLASADIAMPPDVFTLVFGDAPEGQQALDERFSFAHMELPTTFWVPDLDALSAVADRLIIGIGEESAGQMCDRAARSLASVLGIEPTMFPGGHVGFAEDPAAVATTLCSLLED